MVSRTGSAPSAISPAGCRCHLDWRTIVGIAAENPLCRTRGTGALRPDVNRTTRSAHPTRFAELNDVLAELISRTSDVLGSNFIGAYLQGSFALGAGDEFSDVDFVVAMQHDVSEIDRSRLDSLHGELHGRPEVWAQHLEGSYAPAECLRRLSRVPREIPGACRPPEWVDPQTGAPPNAYPFLFLNNGDHSLVRSEHDNTLVMRWVLRERGITLIGPAPREIIDPVNPEELREEVRGVMHSFGASLLEGKVLIDALWLQGFVVLLYCRALFALATATVPSKPEAIRWAGANIDSRWQLLIERAWSQRCRYPRGKGAPEAHGAMVPDASEVDCTLAFVRYAIDLANRSGRKHDSRGASWPGRQEV